jgi:AcrR family transcriptional regulator
MGVLERRAREKDEMRRRIMESATEMFVEEGYESVSMRKIADRIEYAPSTIYLYFKDKADLVASICFETFGELSDRLDEIKSLGLPLMETLRLCLRAYIDFGLEHPSAYGFVFCAPPVAFNNVDAETHAAIGQVGQNTFAKLVEGIKACMDAGCIAPGDPVLKAQATWLLMHGVVAGFIFDCGFPFLDKNLLIEHALDRIIDSLN